MDLNGPKWTEMDRNRQMDNRHKMIVHFGPFRSISVHSGPFRSIQVHFGPFRSISVHSGPFRSIQVHFGPFRSISVHSGPFRSIQVHSGPFRGNCKSPRIIPHTIFKENLSPSTPHFQLYTFDFYFTRCYDRTKI